MGCPKILVTISKRKVALRSRSHPRAKVALFSSDPERPNTEAGLAPRTNNVTRPPKSLLRGRFRMLLLDKPIDLGPILGTRSNDVLVRAIPETDCVVSPRSQPLNVLRRIVNIDVCADLIFLFHEAQVRVGKSVLIQPANRLAHSFLVEEVDKEPMGNDP